MKPKQAESRPRAWDGESGASERRAPDRTTLATVSTVIAVALTWLGALGVTWAQDAFPATQDPVSGARLFKAKGCARCHAIDGVGSKEGPDLGHGGQPRSFDELTASMWNHLPEMARRMWPSPGDRPYLTPDEMSDVIAFLYASGSRDTQPRVEGGNQLSAGDPERGRQLLTAKGCLSCHSLTGPRGRAAGSLDGLKGVDSPWTIIATMWNHAFLMELKAEEGKRPWPTLRSDEMADIVAFLRVHAYADERRR
jgi:mono/diheme cytochrome c family protein